MDLRRVLRLLVTLGLLVLAAAVLARLGPRDWPSSLRDAGPWLAAPPPEARVVAFAVVAAYGCLAWLGYALLAVAAGQARWVPGAARRLAERALGVTLVGAAAGVLAAGSAAADGPFDRPAPPARASPATRPAATGGGHVVVVRPGDTLWDLAGADWPRWYAANRSVVGPDPGLIHPGQRLVPPGGVP
ncbi:MAG: hypothetical protein QOE45_987 [Frankiaceae bacterium]|jgi:hypothetical protein|nr:hypothetical protein [Frankiaceae bacterium]